MIRKLLITIVAVLLWSGVAFSQSKFGNDTIETAGSGTLENAIRGGASTCPENGTATSITVYIDNVTSSANSYSLRCAIYKASDTTLVAQTDEVTGLLGSDADAWHTLSFSSPPALTGGTEYILMAWCSAVASTTVNARLDLAGSLQKYWAQSPFNYTSNSGNFPTPLAGTLLDATADFSIYCTYTPASGGKSKKWFPLGEVK